MIDDAEEQVLSAITRIRMLLGPLDKPEVDIFTVIKMIRDKHFALAEYYKAAEAYYTGQFRHEEVISHVNRLEAARRALLEGK